MGAAIQGKFTIRIRARRSLERCQARPSIRTRLWPWAPPSRLSLQSGSGQVEIFGSSQSGLGQNKIFGMTPSKEVNPDEAVAMGAAIQGKFTIRIRARRSRPARPSIRTRLWPWAPQSRVRSQSGLGQGEIFDKTPSKTVNPDRVSDDTDEEEKVQDLIISDTKNPMYGSYPQSSILIRDLSDSYASR